MATRTICSSLLNGELFRKRCVTFEYSNHLAPYLEYQYPGEALKSLPADSYTLSNSFECTAAYKFDVYYKLRRCYRNDVVAEASVLNLQITGILDKIIARNIGATNAISVRYIKCDNSYGYLNLITGTRGFTYNTCLTSSPFSPNADYYDMTNSITNIFNIRRVSGVDPCTFKAYKQDQLIYSETRSTCPIVNIYSCQLNQNNRIEISLNPFEVLFITEGGTGTSEIAEQIQFYINAILLGGSELAQTIANLGADFVEDIIDGQPDSCILLWKFNINDFPYFHSLGQFCSYETCPQPLYTLDCKNCGCPPDTCEVKCGDKTCCYDKNGKAVEMF